jgi:hypothetical protein
MAHNDDTVFCNLQMSLPHSKELLLLMTQLRESGAHPNLEAVFAHIQYKLANSIEFIENPSGWGDWFPTRH